MSIVCGIVTLEDGAPQPASWIKAFRGNVSRNGKGSTYEYSDERTFLLKLDVGAFPGSGWMEDGERICALAGDSVVPGRPNGRSRNDDLRRISQCDEADLDLLLGLARGNFSFFRCTPLDNTVVVGTDRLGLRPVYWMQTGGFLVFSTVVRLLLELPDISIEPDMRGLIESVAFGFALEDRTEYKQIRILQGGELLLAKCGSVSKHCYWNWCSDTGEQEYESPDLRRELYEEFLRSIELRSSKDATVYAALSGGLDSRCVVGGLIELGRNVRAVNVSWPDSQDQLFARAMASELSIPYLEDTLAIDEAGEGFYRKSMQLIREDQHRPSSPAHVSQQLWGGNDGSISVGFVYVTQKAVSHLRDGDLRSAAQEFLAHKGIGVSRRIFASPYVEATTRHPVEGMVEVFEALKRDDPGQGLFMFLLLTYQRRMMHRDLENVDLDCTERVEPFFDTSFLAKTCRLPVDAGMHHGFYHRWLEEFPEVMRSIPWQTYPGHEKCPLNTAVGAASQWEYYSQIVRMAKARKTSVEFDSNLKHALIATDILDWSTLRLVRLGQRLRLINGDYALRQANYVHKILSPIY